jgi:hypothetical protein
MDETADKAAEVSVARSRVNWRQVGLFLTLTFGLTWVLNWAIWRVGFGTPPMLVLL